MARKAEPFLNAASEFLSESLQPFQSRRRRAGGALQRAAEKTLQHRLRRVFSLAEIVNITFRHFCALDEVFRRMVERLVRLAGAFGQLFQAFWRQAERMEGRRGGAPSGALESRIGIGGVLEKVLAFAPAEIDQRLFGQAKQGAQHPALREKLIARHAGETGEAAAARQPDQYRLPLIVAMVRRGHGLRAERARMSEQQGVTGFASALLDAAVRLFAAPKQNVVREAQRPGPFGRLARPRGPKSARNPWSTVAA